MIMGCCDRVVKYFKGTLDSIVQYSDTHSSRVEVCSSCPELIRFNNKKPEAVASLDRCRACGCFVAAKAAIPIARCPRGRW